MERDRHLASLAGEPLCSPGMLQGIIPMADLISSTVLRRVKRFVRLVDELAKVGGPKPRNGDPKLAVTERSAKAVSRIARQHRSAA